MESFDPFDDYGMKLDPRLEEYREMFEDAGMFGWLLNHQQDALDWLKVLERQKRESEAAGNQNAVPRLSKAVA